MENKIEIRKTYFADDILQIENTLEHAILSEENICTDILNNTYNFFVITYDGFIAGYIVFSNCIDHTDLISVAIKPLYRRLGLAKELIKYMEKLCKENDIYPVLLEVRKNNIPAINLYESLGYKNINTRKNYYTNPTEDALIYIKTSPNT